MNSLARVINSVGSRNLLLGLAGLLLLLNLGRWLQSSYQADQATLESRQASLARYRDLADRGPGLRAQLERLTAERERVVKYLFTGANEENIVSAMQLDLQALVTTAGLETESIRPLKQKSEREGEGGKGLGEVAIKASLAGTLEQYQAFLAELFRSGKFYTIESVTLSPYKKSELKILLDLRGYFIITGPAVEVAAEPAAAGPDKPVTAGPERPVVAGADKPASAGPNRPAAGGPDQPVEEPNF